MVFENWGKMSLFDLLSLALWAILFVISIAPKSTLAFGQMATISLMIGSTYGGFSMCAIQPGSLRPACYGTDAYNDTNPPDQTLWAITGGYSTSCGLTYGFRNLVCWGDFSSEVSKASASVPSLYRNINYSSISSGGWHSCAVRDSGEVDCWGYDHYEDTVPFSFPMSSVTVGETFSCGLRLNDSKYVMWGSYSQATNMVAEQGLQYDTISAGGYHVCGIEKSTKRVVCWGHNDHKQCEPPESNHTYSSLSCGSTHSCGLRSDNREAVCWGDNGNNILDAPVGVPFSFISASVDHTCGVRLDKEEIVCWGSAVETGNIASELVAIQSICMDKCGNDQYGISSGSNCLSSSDKFCFDCSVCSSGTLESSPCQNNSDRVCSNSSSTPKQVSSPASSIPPTSKDSPSHSKTIPVSIVVAAVAGAIVLIGATVISLYVYFRHKHKHDIWEDQRNRIEAFTSSQLQMATSNYSPSAILGRGATSTVYKGTLNDGRIVAIKKCTDPQIARCFPQELNLLKDLNHTCLVNLVGYCRKEQILVFEYMEHGSVYDCLFDGKQQLSWQMRLKIATQASKGLEYLHNFVRPPVIHRDVKASNVLLDSAWNAHVADFGLSVIGPIQPDDSHISNLTVVGTPGYLDPEYHQTHRLTLKSDVYSFGALLLELLCGKRAILLALDLDHVERVNIVNMLDPSIQLPTDPSLLVEAFELGLQCIHQNGASRPTMEIVARTLENCFRNLIDD